SAACPPTYPTIPHMHHSLKPGRNGTTRSPAQGKRGRTLRRIGDEGNLLNYSSHFSPAGGGTIRQALEEAFLAQLQRPGERSAAEAVQVEPRCLGMLILQALLGLLQVPERGSHFAKAPRFGRIILARALRLPQAQRLVPVRPGQAGAVGAED